MALVAKPIGEADKGITFISVRTSRFAKGKDALSKGMEMPYILTVDSHRKSGGD